MIKYWLTCLGYWLRPYDMLADRRRWRWQPRQRCTVFAACSCEVPSAWIVADVNGHKTWCGACGGLR